MASTPPVGDATWSIITVTYNSSGALERFWEPVDLPPNVEWIVVDNASIDGSAEIARGLGARVIELDRNRGFGVANNIGFRASRGSLVGFVNPDVEMRVETLETLASVIRDTGGLVAPQLLHPDGRPQPNGRGYPFLAEKILGRVRPEKAAARYYRICGEREVRPVVWVIGAVVTAAREVFTALGPWDEHFFVYYEDSDLGLRARALGLSCTVVGSARWVHGWARETRRLALGPWRHELASLAKFYARYPRLLSPRPGSASLRLAANGWPAK